MKVSKFTDEDFWIGEIEKSLIQRDCSKMKNIAKPFEVEHSYIDFQQMIITQKFYQWNASQHQRKSGRYLNGSSQQYVFDDYELSKLMCP